MKKCISFSLCIFSLYAILSAAQIKYAGARSSYYGIYPFPTGKQWSNINLNMAAQFDSAQTTAVWIVGGIRRDTVKHVDYCRLEFPAPDSIAYDSITFYKNDKHEPYLSYFDSTGVKVYLQVESGDADVELLIDLVLSQYGHHPCVAGFGVDAEWYLINLTPQTGTKVSDVLAEAWDTRIKSYASSYKLFLKHWDSRWMPPGYRSDIVFINDSQGYDDVFGLIVDFRKWANTFNQNIVMFQVGYPSDYTWWKDFDNPPKELGEMIIYSINNPGQEIGITWVDFTLDESEVAFLWNDINAIEHVTSPTLQSSNLHIMYEQLNATVSIHYDIPTVSDNTILTIQTTNGSMIESYMLNCHAGKIRWNAGNYASGVYFITLRDEYNSLSQKVILQKR